MRHLKRFTLLVLVFLTFETANAQKFWLLTRDFSGGPKTAITGLNDSCLFVGLKNGVMRSCDEGYDWQTVLHASFIHSLHMTKGRLMVAGGTGKVFVSGDLGASWDSVSLGTHFPVHQIISNSTGELFAIASDVEGFTGITGAGMFYSADGGRSWQARSNDQVRACDQLAIDKQGRLYLTAMEIPGTSLGGFFISEDKGHTWQKKDIFFDGQNVVENKANIHYTTGLSLSADSVHLSFHGYAGTVSIRLNLSKAIRDITENSFWTVHKVLNYGNYQDRLLNKIHFSANGDRYSSTSGNMSIGGSYFMKHETPWIRHQQGLGLPETGNFGVQHFYELSNGKVYMIQYLDERIYWADTSVITSIDHPQIKLQAAKIYPNPVSKGSRFSIEGIQIALDAAITLTDLHGRQVYVQGPQDRRATEMLAPSEPGIYFLSVGVGNDRHFYKLIVE